MLGRERRAVRGGEFFGAGGDGHHKDHDDVDHRREAAAENGAENPERANPGDINAGVRGHAGADAGPGVLVIDAIEAARRRESAFVMARLFALGAGRAGFGVRRAVDRAHLLERALHRCERDDGAVRGERRGAFVGDGLFKIAQHFGFVRIAVERAFGLAHVGAQRVVGAFVQLIGVAGEIDRDDAFHG